jgi:hypothetical protein
MNAEHGDADIADCAFNQVRRGKVTHYGRGDYICHKEARVERFRDLRELVETEPFNDAIADLHLVAMFSKNFCHGG